VIESIERQAAMSTNVESGEGGRRNAKGWKARWKKCVDERKT
jgi:hypothetical protein